MRLGGVWTRLVGGARRAGTGLVGAVTFLTVVPLPRRLTAARFELADAVAWFPLVGGALGAAAGALRLVTQPGLGAAPATVLAMAVLVLGSGAIHQDALADTADGLGVRLDRERRLQVMRDSTLGAFGVLALIGWALLLFSVLEPFGTERGLRVLAAAAALGRLAAPLHALAAPPARADGLGAGLQARAVPISVAVVLAAAIAAVTVGPTRGALALLVSVAVALASALLARRTVGGFTGDTLGAAIALAELGVCVAMLAAWH